MTCKSLCHVVYPVYNRKVPAKWTHEEISCSFPQNKVLAMLGVDC